MAEDFQRQLTISRKFFLCYTKQQLILIQKHVLLKFQKNEKLRTFLPQTLHIFVHHISLLAPIAPIFETKKSHHIC